MDEIQNEQVSETPVAENPEHNSLQQSEVWFESAERPLPPFTQCHEELNEVSLSLGGEDSEQYVGKKQVVNVLIKEASDRSQFSPSLILNFDREQILEHLNCDEEDLNVSISIRDKTNKTYREASNFPLSSCPSQFDIDQIQTDKLCFDSEVQFCVTVYLNKFKPRTFNEPYFKGSVLAQKRFVCVPEAEGPSFQFKPRNDEFFIQRGYPAGTFLFVEIVGDIAEDPPETAVHVNINDRVVNRLGKALRSGTAGKLFGAQINLEILFEVCYRAFLLIDGDEVEEGSLLFVLHRLFKQHDLSLGELKAQAQENPFLLKSYLMERQKVVKQIETADIRQRQ